MKNKVYKLQEIDDEIINLYIECFKSDKIYTSRDRNILKNRDLIKKNIWLLSKIWSNFIYQKI